MRFRCIYWLKLIVFLHLEHNVVVAGSTAAFTAPPPLLSQQQQQQSSSKSSFPKRPTHHSTSCYRTLDRRKGAWRGSGVCSGSSVFFADADFHQGRRLRPLTGGANSREAADKLTSCSLSAQRLIHNAWGMVSLPAVKTLSLHASRLLKGAAIADRIILCGNVPCFVLSAAPAPDLAEAVRLLHVQQSDDIDMSNSNNTSNSTHTYCIKNVDCLLLMKEKKTMIMTAKMMNLAVLGRIVPVEMSFCI
jgi:hypothetical protein